MNFPRARRYHLELNWAETRGFIHSTKRRRVGLGRCSEGLEQGAVVARAVGKGGGAGGLSGSLQFCRNFTSVSKIGRPAKKGRLWGQTRSPLAFPGQTQQQKQKTKNKNDKFLRLEKRQMGQAIKVKKIG